MQPNADAVFASANLRRDSAAIFVFHSKDISTSLESQSPVGKCGTSTAKCLANRPIDFRATDRDAD